ncbi:MAG: HAD family phosphatase [Deltaproteobacteria bacterium]|nr:HAD family phosphatase [Deltaproteobacteria bacterium]
MLRPIRDLPFHASKNLLGFFFDIDDTFTSHGKIGSKAFEALWLARDSGLTLVPITGRPAGWCDHIARMWPVDGVVGENGAFYFWYDETDRKLKKRFMDTEDVRRQKRNRLEAVGREILRSVPGTAFASDQLYRETDLAIDYCEDVPPLSREDVRRICALFTKHGASCKVSSIHVNGWFGDYGKLDMTKIFVKERWGFNLDHVRERFLFCGDSPNDEPMFAYFPYSAGVKNILSFSEQMKHLPAFLADHDGGEGFEQVVRAILGMRPSD